MKIICQNCKKETEKPRNLVNAAKKRGGKIYCSKDCAFKFKHKKHYDMMGKKFGKLTVIKLVGLKSTDNHLLWECICECGVVKNVRGQYLRAGQKSCGCLVAEMASKTHKTHGMRFTKIWSTWHSMIQRCSKEYDTQHRDYGGRGISVCERWLKFENFYADMGDIPEGMTLDRKNNDGNYEKKNCRWATRKEQCRNRRNSIPIDLHAVAKKRGIGYKHAWSLYRNGKL